MRRSAILAALLLTLPLVGSIHAPRSAEALFEPGNAGLLRLLAAREGWTLAEHPLPAPHEASLAPLVTRLAQRAGVPMPADEAAAFDALDARVRAPVATMLLAVDEAWTLRDRAFARLTAEEQAELAALKRNDATLRSPRALELSAQVDKRLLAESAILLLDTLDAIVTPQLHAAAQAGAWPATATADSVGILRIGGTGTDKERVNRLLQIDPRGDDWYYNNAGGTTLLGDFNPATPDYPIAVSLDLAGNDTYWKNFTGDTSQGAGFLGVGIHYDLAGKDLRVCGAGCQGLGIDGIGYLRDYGGDDEYWGSERTTGAGDTWGIVRDDAGDDLYRVYDASGGTSTGDGSYGILWDRGGFDRYKFRDNSSSASYGWSDSGGHGWLVDEGTFLDEYDPGGYPHTCNDCKWLAGWDGPRWPRDGRGYDNAGGMAALLAENDRLIQP